MMKKLQLIVLFVLLIAITGLTEVFAQQQVTIRDLNTYDFPLTSQADLPTHPLRDVTVTFDAVVIGYPKNSGLASITGAGVPGRIHVFIAGVSAAEDGLDGNSMQIVVAGEERATLESLLPGDVITVVGELTFFNNVGQFNASDVTQIGSVFEDPYTDLEFLLQPTIVSMNEINIPSPTTDGRFRWNAENYTKYIFRYVKVEGVEMLDRVDLPVGRPWFITTDGQSILTSNDTSLRFRNDRTNYADGLNYNWRRLSESLDGPFTPPPTGAVMDLSGFLVVNTFNPGPALDESTAQSTLKIAPWDDGTLWIGDGTDPDNQLNPPDWPNDLVVLGFAPILDSFSITPSGDILVNDEVTLSVNVILPDESYTLESVVVEYAALSPDDDEAETVTVAMSQSGNTFTYTFDNFDAFTTVDYTVVATARTPENVATRARQFGNFVVQSPSQTAPVAFNPGSGTFLNQVNVTLSSATSGANIFYTKDGSDPDDESTPYTGPVVIDQTTTLKAIAYSSNLDPSPITSREYTIEVSAVPVSDLVDLRVGAQDGTEYIYTGILIDDPTGVIVSEYNIGSQMTNLIGTLGAFQGLLQYSPAFDPGNSPGTATVESVTLTLSELNALQHESRLVRIENVTFISEGTFTAGQNLTIVDPSLGDGETFILRTNFAEADYIGTEIPTEPVNITALVGNFNGTLQLIPRFLSDMEPFTNIPDDQKPVEFALAQNYPNPFNPTTNITYSLANVSDVNLVVYDILGRRVATLVNARQQLPGSYNVSFDASRLASGTYIYRLEAGDFVSVKKMLLVK
jgi:hypothetical protein